MGTSIDTDWTNLPARPSYLPFTQQITTYLSEKVLPPRTVDAGLPITHYLNESERETEYSLSLPNGSSRKLIPRKRKDRYILEFTDTRIPGTYELSDPEKIVAKFVVLPSVAESILEKASEENVASAAKCSRKQCKPNRWKGKQGWESYLTMDSRRKFGRKPGRFYSLQILCLAFVEIILLRRFGRLAR